jgi:hypothetical protein
MWQFGWRALRHCLRTQEFVGDVLDWPRWVSDVGWRGLDVFHGEFTVFWLFRWPWLFYRACSRTPLAKSGSSMRSRHWITAGLVSLVWFVAAVEACRALGFGSILRRFRRSDAAIVLFALMAFNALITFPFGKVADRQREMELGPSWFRSLDVPLTLGVVIAEGVVLLLWSL